MPGTSYFNRRLTSLRFEDAASTGLTIDGREGDIQLGTTNAENKEMQPIYDRDSFDGFTPGRDLVQELSVTIMERNKPLTHAVTGTIQDFIHKRNAYSGLTSVTDVGWSFRVIATYDDGAGGTATRTYPCCRANYTPAVGQPANTGAIAIQCFRAPTET